MALPSETHGAGLRAMSTTFSQIEHRILLNPNLTDGAVRLYGVIAMHEFLSEADECNVSHTQLAVELGKKERTIRALLGELLEAKLLRWRPIPRMGQAKAYTTIKPSGGFLPLTLVPTRDEPAQSADTKRQKSAAQVAENPQSKRQKSAAVKRTPVNTPERPEETVAAATAPAPAREAKPPKVKPPASAATPAPDEIELTPALYAHGAALGYDADRVRLEMRACLDYFGSDTTKRTALKTDWTKTFRNWLTKEWKMDQARLSTHGGGYRNARAAHGERQFTGKPGSVVSSDARAYARRTDLDL